jgi:hypothetical protein
VPTEQDARRAISEVAKGFRESQARAGNDISQETAERRVRAAVVRDFYQESERVKR